MLKRLQTYFLFGNRFCGIEHTVKNGDDIIYTTLLKKTKNEVDVDTCFASKKVNEVTNSLPKKQHIFLIINNDHVLTKVFEYEKLHDLKLVNKAFPNINISDFYYEIIQQETKSFISICRKSYINDLIIEYSSLGISVMNFSLGNSIISETISHYSGSSIQTSNALVLINNNSINAIDYTEENDETDYDINGLNINNLYILSSSGSLASILNTYKSSINFQEKKDELASTFKQVRFFGQFLKIGLISILSILLINFLFFNFYFNEVNTLKATSQSNQTTKGKVLKLKEDVTKAQKTIDDMLKSSASKSSFYIDAIINTLPSSILLSEINYQPLEKRIKEDKQIILKNNVIVVSGTSNDSELYSKWINLLDRNRWVKDIEVIEYSNVNTSRSVFSIKLNIIE